MKKAKDIRKIVVCTTDLDSDNNLARFLKEKNIECFRGSDKDILKRLLDAAKYYKTDIIIDVSGDKIYTDIDYVDKITEIFQNKEIDFIHGSNLKNKFNPSSLFIHGIIPGGFRTSALEKICKLKKTTNTEDGYTEFFIKNDTIKKKYIVPKINFEYTNKIKLDLDYPEDLILAKKIFENLGNDFHMKEILELFSLKPDLIKDSEIILEKWKKNYTGKTLNFKIDK
jgi:spore coat polysaccharide biosynthesis protein SpsF